MKLSLLKIINCRTNSILEHNFFIFVVKIQNPNIYFCFFSDFSIEKINNNEFSLKRNFIVFSFYVIH